MTKWFQSLTLHLPGCSAPTRLQGKAPKLPPQPPQETFPNVLTDVDWCLLLSRHSRQIPHLRQEGIKLPCCTWDDLTAPRAPRLLLCQGWYSELLPSSLSAPWQCTTLGCLWLDCFPAGFTNYSQLKEASEHPCTWHSFCEGRKREAHKKDSLHFWHYQFIKQA